MRLGFDGVNKVGELHGILYEEHRNVVSGEGGKFEAIVSRKNAETYPTISQLPSGV